MTDQTQCSGAGLDAGAGASIPAPGASSSPSDFSKGLHIFWGSGSPPGGLFLPRHGVLRSLTLCLRPRRQRGGRCYVPTRNKFRTRRTCFRLSGTIWLLKGRAARRWLLHGVPQSSPALFARV